MWSERGAAPVRPRLRGAAAFLFLYPLSAEKTRSMADELAQRRKSFADA